MSCNFRFAKLIIMAFLITVLFGCAKSPVENIIKSHREHIDEVLGYSYNNIIQTTDVKYLEDELKNCSIALQDVLQTHNSQISACEAKTAYWRVITLGLGLLIVALVFARLKSVF